ncbi:MAG: hypothetical protein IT172_04125 [Acidobacteria bacterium]|nr:hypothetical protein [Acidobacteriota bacterium]
MKVLIAIAIILAGILSVTAQTAASQPADNTLARELAKAALEAHGGRKLSDLKSMTIAGSVDVNVFNQVLPGTFAMVFEGEKYRIDLNNAAQPLKQVFDGTQTFTQIPNSFTLPPLDRVGFYVLRKVGDPSYPISMLPASAKGKSGFRITAPDGHFTDFYIDEKTKQIKGFDSAFEFFGQKGTTSVVIDKFRTADGVIIPERFSQRFDLGQITAYCDFKAKDIRVDTEIAPDVFEIPK